MLTNHILNASNAIAEMAWATVERWAAGQTPMWVDAALANTDAAMAAWEAELIGLLADSHPDFAPGEWTAVLRTPLRRALVTRAQVYRALRVTAPGV